MRSAAWDRSLIADLVWSGAPAVVLFACAVMLIASVHATLEDDDGKAAECATLDAFPVATADSGIVCITNATRVAE